MNKSTTWIAVAAVGASGVATLSPAHADVCTFTATSGIWASASNWDCSGAEDIPDSDDHALIPSGKTCAVDADTDAQGAGVTGTLNIESGNTLTFHGINGTIIVNVQEGGTINLEGSSSVLEFLEDGFIVAEGGDGTIVGQHNDAKILLDNDTTLTNSVIIEAQLQITEAALEDATFVNHGTVRANAGGTLYVNTDVIGDDSTADWKVTHASGVLKLEPTNATAPALAGDFTVSKGTLDIQEVVSTTGDLTQTGGTISVASGAAIEFNART